MPECTLGLSWGSGWMERIPLCQGQRRPFHNSFFIIITHVLNEFITGT